MENWSGIKNLSEVEEIRITALKSESVIEIGADVYQRVAQQLKESIGDSCYHNGSLEFDFEGVYSTFTASLIVYRHDAAYPEGKVSEINDIVPVWWEYSTTLKDRGEVLNDFSFAELKTVFLAI